MKFRFQQFVLLRCSHWFFLFSFWRISPSSLSLLPFAKNNLSLIALWPLFLVVLLASTMLLASNLIALVCCTSMHPFVTSVLTVILYYYHKTPHYLYDLEISFQLRAFMMVRMNTFPCNVLCGRFYQIPFHKRLCPCGLKLPTSIQHIMLILSALVENWKFTTAIDPRNNMFKWMTQ